jgi:hypothetical protein
MRLCSSFLRGLTLATCALALSSTPVRSGQDEPPTQKEASKELARLHADDQKDQVQWTMADDVEFTKRQKVRRDRVMQLIEWGLLDGLADWDSAAILLQHGETTEDVLLAHVLAIRSGIENRPFGRFMTGATLDRYLMFTKYGKQIFGTQSTTAFASETTYDAYPPHYVDETLRALYDAGPALRLTSDAKAALKKRDKPPSPKQLKKLLPAAKQGADGWLEEARAIARGGAMKSDRDYLLCAEVLLHSDDVDDLLMAHVCAVAALFKKKKAENGRWLAAHTLDRFLLASGKPQKFGTVEGEDGEPAQPYDRAWKNFVRREFETELVAD